MKGSRYKGGIPQSVLPKSLIYKLGQTCEGLRHLGKVYFFVLFLWIIQVNVFTCKRLKISFTSTLSFVYNIYL